MKNNESVYKSALAVWSREVMEAWSRNVRFWESEASKMTSKTSPKREKRGEKGYKALAPALGGLRDVYRHLQHTLEFKALGGNPGLGWF